MAGFTLPLLLLLRRCVAGLRRTTARLERERSMLLQRPGSADIARTGPNPGQRRPQVGRLPWNSGPIRQHLGHLLVRVLSPAGCPNSPTLAQIWADLGHHRAYARPKLPKFGSESTEFGAMFHKTWREDLQIRPGIRFRHLHMLSWRRHERELCNEA